MRATEDVLTIWRRFDDLPMETLTKAWYFNEPSLPKQRTVELMKEHRMQYGTSGNCFDIAIWLMDEFSNEEIDSFAVAYDLFTEHAHVAVVAINYKGYKYFCDLGDQWIQPILIDPRSNEYSEAVQSCFFPAAKTRVKADKEHVEFEYIRPNGKARRQTFNLVPIDYQELLRAAEHSQNLLRHPLVERRIFLENEVQHWEFDEWNSFISTDQGLIKERKLNGREEWIDRICIRTRISKDIIRRALEAYSKEPHN